MAQPSADAAIERTMLEAVSAALKAGAEKPERAADDRKFGPVGVAGNDDRLD
jgi:hypothetical protein